MLEHNEHFHGSDLETVERIYHLKKEEIVSFSSNVNPLGISQKLRETLAEHLDAIASYPDREYTKLRECIASYIGSRPEHIIVGNGATELISLFIQTLRPKKALIPAPTYSEYEREIALGGGAVLYYPLRERDEFRLEIEGFCGALNDSIDLLVLCNPNNPTSSAISRSGLRRILDACRKHRIFVMVDETYVEFAPDEAAITAVPLTAEYENLILLRGTSKFFAAPGLRLGYAVTGNQNTANAVNTRKNPWTINSLAEIAGRLMFTDKEYISRTKALISSERTRMLNVLNSWDFVKCYPPSGNFILMRSLCERVTAGTLFDRCIRKGLMIRDCSSFPGLDGSYVRFCVMMPKDNDRLLPAMREVFSEAGC